ncbi:hypothetical protein [Priestia koreensis]|uniref:hypothetical protein n=1 Tax=Priestia koreensis TaxID=284581 RepID=UPI000AF6C07E|nr:hypothetical protein [Priestia koreensis]
MPRKPKEYKVNVYDEKLETQEEIDRQYEQLKDWFYKVLFTKEYRKSYKGEENAKKN